MAVDRLGSGVRVSASFQMFALTAGWNVLGGQRNCPGGGMFREDYVRGGNVQEGECCRSVAVFQSVNAAVVTRQSSAHWTVYTASNVLQKPVSHQYDYDYDSCDMRDL